MSLEKEEKPIKEESKRLKESEWIIVSSLWESGEVNLKELSERFCISESALSQGLKRRGIKRGAKAHISYKEIEKKTKEEKEKLIEDIFNFKKKFLRIGEQLMTMTMDLLADAESKKESLLSKKGEIDTIISATKVYKTVRNDMYHLYDLYDKENKPMEELDFNIGVYSQDDIDALRESQRIIEEMAVNLSEEDEEDDEFDTDEND